MTEVAIVRPPNAFEPTSYTEAKQLAGDYARSGICKFKSPEQVMLVLATAKDLGVPYTTALRSMYITAAGTVGMEADLMVALCLQSSVCEYFYCTHTDGEKATYTTKRRGYEPQTLSFTLAEAKTAGLVKPTEKGNDSVWMKWGPDMLRHRAAAKLARMVYPDRLGGIYSTEELADFPATAPPSAVKPIVAAPINAAGQNQPIADPGPNVAPPWVDAEEIPPPVAASWEDRIAAAKTGKEIKALADDKDFPKELKPLLLARYEEIKP